MDLVGQLLQLSVELLGDSRCQVDVRTERHLRRRVASECVVGVVGYVQNDQHARLVALQLQTSRQYSRVP